MSLKYTLCLLFSICVIQQLEGQNFIEKQNLLPDEITDVYPGRFGESVSISKNIIVVGAPQGGRRNHMPTGVVFIYSLDSKTGEWTQSHQLFPEDGRTGNLFGQSVLIQDDLIFVGSPNHKRGGSVYVFEKSSIDSVGWEQIAILSPDELTNGAHFGYSIALSEQLLFVGAPRSKVEGKIKGNVYVFQRGDSNSKNWKKIDQIEANDRSYRFGYSISVHKNLAIIGAPQVLGHTNINGGSYVFSKSPDSENKWTQVSKLSFDTSVQERLFGISVYLHDDLAIVGSSKGANVYSQHSGGPNKWGQIATLESKEGFGRVYINKELAIVGAGTKSFVFTKDSSYPNLWNQVSKIENDKTHGDRSYINSVSFYNNHIVIGTRHEKSLGSVSLYSVSDQNYECQLLHKWHGGKAGSYNKFGTSVSIDKNVAIIGSPNSEAKKGSAYVFSYDSIDGRWIQECKLHGPDGSEFKFFGGQVSINGNNAVVSGIRVGKQNKSSMGTAYIFSKNPKSSKWTRVAELIPQNLINSETYGQSLSIFGEVVVIGDRGNPLNNDGGSAFVFSKNSGGDNNWGQIAHLKPDISSAFDWFGTSVSAYENNILVGSPGYSEDDDGSIGCAYVFSQKSGFSNKWIQTAHLKPRAPSRYAYFGSSLSISSDRLIIGAFRDEKIKGSATIFSFDNITNEWKHESKLTAPYGNNGDQFGLSVSIDGDLAIVGAPGKDEPLTHSGCAYFFVKDKNNLAGSWQLSKKIVGENTQRFDEFGTQVDLFGDTIIIGAPENSAGGLYSGSTYIFKHLHD